jgi:hypothetical protein
MESIYIKPQNHSRPCTFQLTFQVGDLAEGKGKFALVKYYAIKTYGTVDVYIDVFLTPALVGDE